MINNFIKSREEISLIKIAEITGATLVLQQEGQGDIIIKGVSSLKNAKEGDISFFTNVAYKEELSKTKALACFIKEKYVTSAPKGLILLVCEDPYASFAKTLAMFFSIPKVEEYISDKAHIDSSAKIGKNVHISHFAIVGKNVIIKDNTYIGPNVVISDDVEIGSSCYIHSGVTIKYATIGDDCIIHEGVRIGQDGFGFVPNAMGHIKIHQVAKVIIGQDVEIGANTCIDRGAVDNTEIMDGTKIDNLVQIAHGVKIGKGCFLAAKVGIAGSTIIEDFVSIGGNTGVAPHIRIGMGSQIGPMSGVSHSVEAYSVLIGIPAIGFSSFWKLQALFRKMLKR